MALSRRKFAVIGYDIAKEADRLAEFYESVKGSDANAH